MSTDSTLRSRFEAVVAEVHTPVMRYLLRRMPAHEAEEVMSDVLLVLWQRVDAIPDPSPLPWCYGVARRALANHRRSSRRRLSLVQKLERQPRYDDTAAADFPELTTALDSLPLAEREVVMLWAWEGLEPREIAQVLETSPNAISVRLSRIKTRLSQEMRKDRPGAGHTGNENTGDRS
jgi:RNA polymerase sigma-70 factor (ECF subfamily)